MHESDFIDAILTVSLVSRTDAAALLDLSVHDAGFDSLDFELLRTALEKRLEKPIPDALWHDAPTMRYLMDRI